MSTDAMIAFALAVLGGDLPDERLSPGRNGDRAPGAGPSQPWIESGQEPAWISVAGRLAKMNAKRFASPTFGADNPFTLYWAVRLADGLVAKSPPVAEPSPIRAKATCLVKNRLETPRKPVLQFESGGTHDRAPAHVWPLVRVVHLARAVGVEPGEDTCRYFVERVLVQLSYSEITDSLFDVGELVFALEGALACDEGSCSRALVERVADVVRAAQVRNPSLRVLSPFRVTGAGSVNTPVSIEVATSLLRSCWILDRSSATMDLFADVHRVFERYVDWLRSTIQTVARPTADDKPFQGWRSEHAFTAEPTIHTWYTSQVLLFLVSYRAMIDQHVASSSLRSARFSVRLPSAGSESWGEREPLANAASAGSVYRVYERLMESFITPRREPPGKKAQSSFLLYGPPGTGKTSLVEALADELGWEMITITPSDFIVGGESQVEARAKDIFDVLTYQSEKVILFDEIDRLLLDRDSPEYGEQSDLFQFMTPSMLPKLQHLNDQRRNIVCIATNYAWRIDRAITRPGRIDRQFLLLPPDREGRKKMVMELRSKGDEARDEVAQKVAEKSPLYTHGELKAAIAMAGPDEAADQVVDCCRQITPTAGLGPYRQQLSRLNAQTRSLPRALVEEYLLLRFLEVEADPASSAGLTCYDLELIGGMAALAEVRDAAVRMRLSPASS